MRYAMTYTRFSAALLVMTMALGIAGPAQAQEQEPDRQKGLEDGRHVATLAAGSAGDHRFSGAAYFADAGSSLSYIILCDGAREFARARVQVRTRAAIGEYRVTLRGRTAAGAQGVSFRSIADPSRAQSLSERDGTAARVTLTAVSDELIVGTVKASVQVAARQPHGLLEGQFRAIPVRTGECRAQ